MRTNQVIQYIDEQKRAIEALVGQLDEIQVAFNAQFDEFKRQHDAQLDALTDQVATRLDAISPKLRAKIEAQLSVEKQEIAERRRKLRHEYLPQRQEAADELLGLAQKELAELRALNPQLDEKEEGLKRLKTKLEGQLESLNDEVRQKSRGLGVVFHFRGILKADRERQRIIGRLEGIQDSLRNVRQQWETENAKAQEQQAEYQKRWQLESIAVARLQSELDQLDDETVRDDLALKRATRQILDDLKEPAPGSDPEIEAGLNKMVELNIQTDAYHAGLASVGGFIGLLKGIASGSDAIRTSIESLEAEQKMHSAYLKALAFTLPDQVTTFNKQWAVLAEQFADEKAIGANPSEFSANVEPILAGPLSEAKIEAMFKQFGQMIKKATDDW